MRGQLNAGASEFVPSFGGRGGQGGRGGGYAPQPSYPHQQSYAPQHHQQSYAPQPYQQSYAHQHSYAQQTQGYQLHQGYHGGCPAPTHSYGYQTGAPSGVQDYANEGYAYGGAPPQGWGVAPPEPAPAAADPKLRLGGAKGTTVVMPKKARGGKLDLTKSSPSPAATSSTSQPSKAGDTTGSPTTAKETSAKDAGAAAAPKDTAASTKEAILKDIEKRRQGKTFVRDPRPHFSVVFCGHVDSGKSTISGRLLADNNVVDAREMDKLRREASQFHREGWEYAYIMDLSEEERSKGKTHETGSMYFETPERRITILDAPGHKAFVPSMIGGATQADLGVMVISARMGEFETGFEHGGQTREHAILVRTCGIPQLLVAVNKMDDCAWSRERYDEIVHKLKPFFEGLGYKEKQCVFFPISGLAGVNVTLPLDSSACPWFSGPTMMEFMNQYNPPARSENDILCLPLVATFKEDGKVFLSGKCESGSIVLGDRVQILPSKSEATVEGIQVDQTDLDKCYPGDTVLLRVKGIEESDGRAGSVVTSIPTTLRSCEYFQARVVVLEVRNILCAGSKAMMHIHTCQVEVTVHKLLATIDRTTDCVLVKEPTHVKGGDTVMMRLEAEHPIVAVVHTEIDRMGRFMLRDEGKTIAVGLVTRLYDTTKDSATATRK